MCPRPVAFLEAFCAAGSDVLPTGAPRRARPRAVDINHLAPRSPVALAEEVYELPSSRLTCRERPAYPRRSSPSPWTLAAHELRLEGGRKLGGICVETTGLVSNSEVVRIAFAQVSRRSIDQCQLTTGADSTTRESQRANLQLGVGALVGRHREVLLGEFAEPG